MATQAGKLVQEIHDEFLVCKICMSPFKTPKCLSCLHTFCEVCIENHIASEAAYKKYSDYREFTCPLCRKRTQLPVGGAKKLPDNFLISNLSDTMDRQQKSSTSSASCDICKMIGRRTREQATSKCLDCNKLLCRSCVEQHKETKVTRDHSIFDVETEKDIICKDHPDEVVRFYCEPCQACVCIICAFNEHKEHEVSNFSEAVVKYKTDIEGVLAVCKSKIGVYEKYMERVSSTERQITEAEKKIRELAIEFVSDVRQREKQLVEEVHNLYGKQTMEVIGRKAELQSALETLKSTCALTEIVLQGKDMELLLLKREVQEKLSSLSQAMEVDLPKTMTKEIRFLPGHIELGSIQDMDKPNASKFRSCIISNSSFSSLASIDTVGPEEQPELQSAETQTEPVEFLLESVDFTPTRDVGQFSTGLAAAAAAAATAPPTESTSSQTDPIETQLRCRDQETATEQPEMEDKAVNTVRPSRTQGGAADGAETGRRSRRAETVNGQQEQEEQQQQQQQQQQEQQSATQSGFMSRRRRRMQYGMSLDEDMGGSAL